MFLNKKNNIFEEIRILYRLDIPSCWCTTIATVLIYKTHFGMMNYNINFHLHEYSRNIALKDMTKHMY